MSLTGKSLIVLCPSSHQATKTKVSQMTNQIIYSYITKLYVLITCFGHSTARVWNRYIYNIELGMICGSKCENGNCILLHVLNMLRWIPNAQSLRKNKAFDQTQKDHPFGLPLTNRKTSLSKSWKGYWERTMETVNIYSSPPEMKHLPNSLPSTILSELGFGRCI